MAGRAIGLAELRIGQARAVLNDLLRKRVDSCQPAHLETLRQTVFISGAVKELALVGPNGQTLCTDSAGPVGSREVVASAATSSDDLMLDVLRIGDRQERMLRVRRIAPGQPHLAALIPASLLLPQVAPNGAGVSGSVRMTLADGTLIGTVDAERPTSSPPEDQVVTRQRSDRYGMTAYVTMAHEGVIATYDDLRRIGMVASGVIALVFLGLALLVPWRRHNPLSEIERALLAGEFIPYYQPVVDIKSGRILGAEVLVRWRKPDGTIVGPGAFIPLVESSGLIIDMTRVLMRHVCREAGPAIGRRPNMYVAFNIAPRHLTDSVLLNDVGSIFEGSPIGLSQVVLEVTERNEITNLGAARRVIAALQALGCRVALDDVGTGHSGLSYILKLGIDIIKIDRVFVEAIKTERHSQAIVGTLVELARNLRMQIIAEGVENFEQVTYLREHGISAVQGFVFAPPLPGPAFLQLIEAMDPNPAAAPAAVEHALDDLIPAIGEQVAA